MMKKSKAREDRIKWMNDEMTQSNHSPNASSPSKKISLREDEEPALLSSERRGLIALAISISIAHGTAESVAPRNTAPAG